MTSQPEVPGAAAVYLNWNEETDDLLHRHSVYARVKVLTEAGKDAANVSLAYGSYFASGDTWVQDFSQTVTDVAGRTIHSDGTVIPFTGKPYERVLEKKQGERVSETVFTLPDVEVGSILEYRYNVRISDNYFVSPQWFVQKELFVRTGHYLWKASDLVMDEDTDTNVTYRYSAVLPKGTEVKILETPGTSTTHGYHRFELETHNLPPVVEEPFMPPTRSLSYQVRFYWSRFNTHDQFWKEEGKEWAKEVDKFAGWQAGLPAPAQTLVASGDSDTVKLQKIYAAVMALDNTNYSRQHSESENKAHGLGKTKTANDIWERKSGTEEELTALFVALARGAGMKAYMMAVTNRDTNLFSPAWLSLGQLNDLVAIVVLDGKEQYFDPGQRFCPFGQMAWKHTSVGGLRELENGATALAMTPDPPYTQSVTQRTGEITVNADGTARGTLRVTWTGAYALGWRQAALRRDETAAKRLIKDWTLACIPAGMEVKVETIENLTDYEKPLVATMSVHGQFATVSAKRLILPSQFYESSSKPLFPQTARDIPIYFEHGGRVVDAVRVGFSGDLKVESVPKDNQFMLQKLASYRSIPSVQGSTVLIRRQFDLGTPIFMPKEYGDVRDFFNKMADNDQQPIVLLRPEAVAEQSNAQPKAEQ